jgi:DNA methylase
MKVLDQEQGDGWVLYRADSAEALAGLPSNSIDFCMYSPPFESLFVYQASERDIGNCSDSAEFFTHYRYIADEVLRLVKPGRRLVVHAMDLAIMQFIHGYQAVRPFTDELVRFHMEQGWRYVGRITVQTNPQAHAARLHSRQLLFVQLEKDRSWLRPALPQQLLLFQKAGENATPIVGGDQISRDEWIEMAAPIWLNIRETDTLNAAEGRAEEDEKHTAPLALPLIERCVRLWSNPREVVLDPFSGLGSVGFVAIQQGRRYIGCELKESYWQASIRFLKESERLANQPNLFTDLGEAFA